MSQTSFTLSSKRLNGQRCLTQRTATFFHPELVHLSTGDVEVTSVTLEPNGTVYLIGTRAGKKRTQMFNYHNVVIFPKNGKVDETVQTLKQSARQDTQEYELELELSHEATPRPARRIEVPVSDLSGLNFAFLA
jgi:hypothetical protein